MSILSELRFKRNVSIYKMCSFKDFENVIFVFKSFFWKIIRLGYILLVKNDQ